MLTFGSLSEEGRSDGIQQDAMQNATGSIQAFLTHWNIYTGVFSRTTRNEAAYYNTGEEKYSNINFDLSKVVRTSSETRGKNRKIRVYKRIA